MAKKFKRRPLENPEVEIQIPQIEDSITNPVLRAAVYIARTTIKALDDRTIGARRAGLRLGAAWIMVRSVDVDNAAAKTGHYTPITTGAADRAGHYAVRKANSVPGARSIKVETGAAGHRR
jgi:hypothetical protein